MAEMNYGRALTAISMAKGENRALENFLRQHRAALVSQIQAIDEFLKTSSTQTDAWYEAISKEERGDFSHWTPKRELGDSHD